MIEKEMFIKNGAVIAGPQESTTLSEFKDSIRKGGAHD